MPLSSRHELYKKAAADDYGDFNESKPAIFKGSLLGEGRISTFTAAAEGLFGSKLRGYHVTLLTRDRRVTILCHCPEKELAKFKPIFLAVCRNLSRYDRDTSNILTRRLSEGYLNIFSFPLAHASG